MAAFKLLLAYDGSESAEIATRDLQKAGLPAETEAVVLSVADVWPYTISSEPAEPLVTDLDRAIQRRGEQLRARATAALEEAASVAERGAAQLQALFPSWTVRTETATNWPAWGVIMKAEQWKADLVVVGAGERSAVERFKFGSVSRKVVGSCRQSVRIGRETVNPGAPVRVLIGIDGSPHADLAAGAVASRAWPAGSEARIMTVLERRLALAVPSLIPDLARWSSRDAAGDDQNWVSRMLEQTAERLRKTGLSVSTKALGGNPRRALLEEAREWKADCVFVGARGLGAVERFLIGSVSSAVAAEARCSVEVIRSGAA